MSTSFRRNFSEISKSFGLHLQGIGSKNYQHQQQPDCFFKFHKKILVGRVTISQNVLSITFFQRLLYFTWTTFCENFTRFGKNVTILGRRVLLIVSHTTRQSRLFSIAFYYKVYINPSIKSLSVKF